MYLASTTKSVVNAASCSSPIKLSVKLPDVLAAGIGYVTANAQTQTSAINSHYSRTVWRACSGAVVVLYSVHGNSDHDNVRCSEYVDGDVVLSAIKKSMVIHSNENRNSMKPMAPYKVTLWQPRTARTRLTQEQADRLVGVAAMRITLEVQSIILEHR